MAKILIALLIVSCLGKLGSEHYFNAYLSEYSKSYSEEEYHYRHNIFLETLKRIELHNSNPEHTWKMGINEFSDWTDEEFMAKRVSEPQNCSATVGNYNPVRNVELPTSVDWRIYGVVSPVKNQGQCGSCWSFSTTGALESHWALQTGTRPPPDLSEQQLVDCAGAFNNFGCNGGLPSQAFEYIKYAGGLTSEAQYPYTAKDGKCRSDYSVVAYAKGGSYNISLYDENALVQAIAENGPVSIAFEVISGFKDYKSGIYSSPACSTLPDHVNHAVLAVGYGVSGNQLYYIVKNSWGDTWGDKGYFLIQRGVNMCGVADCASFPIIR
jgi:cathepsin H